MKKNYLTLILIFLFPLLCTAQEYTTYRTNEYKQLKEKLTKGWNRWWIKNRLNGELLSNGSDKMEDIKTGEWADGSQGTAWGARYETGLDNNRRGK